MSGLIDRRIQALEASLGVNEPVTIIRVIALPGQQDAEPGSADVGGKSILRASDETGEAFMTRVESEARLAAKPGCVRVALVWPRTASDANGLVAATQRPGGIAVPEVHNQGAKK